MASRECFQNELLLCDVTVLLNFGVSQRRLSVSRSWGRFWIKKKHYFTREMAAEFTRCSAGINYWLVFRRFLSNYRLATAFHSEVITSFLVYEA